MSKRFVTPEDIPILNELLKGWNVIDDEKDFNKLLRKNKWGIAELKFIKKLVKDGFRPAMDIVFITWNSHISYMKYIGTDITPPPTISMRDMQAKIISPGN